MHLSCWRSFKLYSLAAQALRTGRKNWRRFKPHKHPIPQNTRGKQEFQNGALQYSHPNSLCLSSEKTPQAPHCPMPLWIKEQLPRIYPDLLNHNNQGISALLKFLGQCWRLRTTFKKHYTPLNYLLEIVPPGFHGTYCPAHFPPSPSHSHSLLLLQFLLWGPSLQRHLLSAVLLHLQLLSFKPLRFFYLPWDSVPQFNSLWTETCL